MKRSARFADEDALLPDEPKLDISSLIDVCFLLLIYFLVTTTIQPREQDLETRIPMDHAAIQVALPPMIIEVREGGEVVVNPGDGAEVFDADVSCRELAGLSERLRMMAVFGSDNMPRVLLRVDDEVVQQRYIDVINCLAGHGVRDIAIAD